MDDLKWSRTIIEPNKMKADNWAKPKMKEYSLDGI